jgi:hypothetical protein
LDIVHKIIQSAKNYLEDSDKSLLLGKVWPILKSTVSIISNPKDPFVNSGLNTDDEDTVGLKRVS